MHRKLLVTLIAITLVTTLSLSAWAQEFRVPLTTKAPVIDGKIDPAEWAVAAGFDGFGFSDKLGQRRVQAWVAADENNFYIAIRSQLPEEGNLAATKNPALSTIYYAEDTTGLQITPQPEGVSFVQYQILTNSLGFNRYRVHLKGSAVEDPGWNGDWKYAYRLENGFWEWECAIPISSMPAVAKGRKTTDGLWKIDLERDFKGPMGAAQSLSCVAVSSGFSEGGIHMFTGVPFRFVKDAPAVQYSTSSDPFLTGFTGKLSILNPSSSPIALDALIFIDRDRMPEIQTAKKLTLAPGEKQEVNITCPQDENSTGFGQTITVKSADGKTVYYDRAVKWPKAGPYHYKGANVQVKIDPIQLDYAYYPYRNKMKVAVDISGMPKEAELSGVTAIVREVGGKVIKEIDFPLGMFKNGKQEQSFELPALKGQYELIIRPEGKNTPAEIVKQFERTTYEWEHNTLGMSDKVYPPFTPIKVQGNKLSTVLRVHTLNNQGLLDQIMGESAETHVAKPILSSPMHYLAVIDGKRVATVSAPLKITSARPNEVTTEAFLSLGALKASATSTWDYDGTVKVELTLLPTGGKQVNSFTLEIPFDARAATMIHANADRIRAPVAKLIPQGSGIVWDASKVSTNEWPREFCPYVFIGNAVRGLSWFAENDKGWGWDSNTPNLDIVRRGKEVVLRVHFINKPTVITEPRNITFGLLAAPVKPRLNPAKNPNWWRYRYTRDNYTLLGTDINWLAYGNCASVYPAGKDLYLWQMIARGNVEHLTADDVQACIERGKGYYAAHPDEEKAFEGHARYNLVSRYGMKMIFYYNRASYQDCDEFQTFKDEWDCTNYRSVDKGTGIDEIKVVPCPSYNDYCMYWYAKSFDVGRNMGVYWDNLFTIPTYNSEMTDAYTNDDGTVTPASSIWELRDLVKRTFVMMNERGMLPVTFPHMTSFNPLPVMSFATMQYDWEWKYSGGEVQDRHTREYLQLATNGELAGVWPEPLGDQGSQAGDPWIQRTFEAVRLIHELDNGPVPQAILDIIDQPGAKAYRYWDDVTPPVVSGSADVPTLVYSVPGKEAVVVVVSYSAGDENVALKVDPRALGLSRGYAVIDAETKTDVKVAQDKITFPLKKHEMRILKITDGKN